MLKESSETKMNGVLKKMNRHNLFTRGIPALFGLAFLWFLYSIREFRVFHGPLFWVSKYPFMWQLPLLVSLLTVLPFLIRAFLKRSHYNRELAKWQTTDEGKEAAKRITSGYYSRQEARPSGLDYHDFGSTLQRCTIAFFVIGFIVWIPSLVYARMQTAVATYKHYTYTQIKTLPQGGAVRIMPKKIADELSLQSGNTSGFSNVNGHIVLDPRTNKLIWTYEEAPHGFYNHFAKQSQGIAILKAEHTDREVSQIDSQGNEFCYAPSLGITDSIRWQILSRHYFVDPDQPVALVTKSGEPLFIDSYVKYVGWPFKHPEVGGVMVFHDRAHGCKIEDLSVKEASIRPDLIASGRIFPEHLARDVQDDYGYKHGAANTVFGHRDQTQINNVDSNPMPYLMSFNKTTNGKVMPHLKWVSIAEPTGRAYATNAIFLTDAITGKTEVWRTSKKETLTGAARSIQTVRSLPGIVWSNFEPVEPRPAFFNGRLQYMLSIIPVSDQANTVSKTVFVDAAKNKVVAIFNNDTDPQADEKIQAYIKSGNLDSSNAVNGSAPLPVGGQDSGGGNASLAAQIDALLAQNAKMQANLEKLRAEVAAKKK
jgi:hypothetical protein